MAKKLRLEPIYIAPQIKGYLNNNGNPYVVDERTGNQLDPFDINDKIIIYERQVNEWFLYPAKRLIKYKNKNNGFIVLMICLSYFEGVEQYRRGESSRGRSGEFFAFAIERLYPGKYSRNKLNAFYSQARCGLFHNGMVEERIIINNGFQNSLEFIDNDIKISPSKLLKDIENDFINFLHELRTDPVERNNFGQMFSNM